MLKRNEVAVQEAKLALLDFDSLSKQLEGSKEAEDPKVGPSTGRMVFNAGGNQAPKSSNRTESNSKIKSDKFYDNSDSEDDLEAEENNDPVNRKSSYLQKDVDVDPILFNEDSNIHQSSIFKVISVLVFHFLWIPVLLASS